MWRRHKETPKQPGQEVGFPKPDGEVLTSEQAAKRTMFKKVALLYGFRGEDATKRMENLVINLDGLKQLVEGLGYYYGKPPHEMSLQMVDELEKVGKTFLQGSGSEENFPKYLGAGLDIFKTIIVTEGTYEYREWDLYLTERTAKIKE